MASDSSKPNQSGAALPRGLIGRGGNVVGQGTRLPSLRSPRDLTLGGVAKRTFAPTISAAQKPKTAIKTENSIKKEHVPERFDSVRGRGRGDGGGRGGRGRGRGRGQLTQMSGGLFSEGVAQTAPKKFQEQETRQSLSISKPKLEESKPEFKNTADEEQYVNDRLKQLMCDDFIDDGEMDPYVDVPTKLPILHWDFEVKETNEWKKLEEQTEIKEKVDTSIPKEPNAVRIKSEPIDESEKIEPDVRPPLKTIKPDVPCGGEIPSLTASVLLRNLCKLGKDELVLFRVPDEFASLVNTKDDRPVIKQEPGTGLATGHREDIKSNLPQLETKTESSLSDFPEGYLGKLQILKSGKTRLALGNSGLDVELGGPVEFLQDLVAMQTSSNPQTMAVLGHIRHTLICTPEFDQFLMSEDTS